MKSFIFLLFLSGTAYSQIEYDTLNDYLLSQNIDSNKDGTLNEDELLSVKRVHIYNVSLRSIKGINKLKNVESIEINNLNELKDINISNLTKLNSLNLGLLEKLNNLTILNSPKIQSIDISFINKSVDFKIDEKSSSNIKSCSLRGFNINLDFSTFRELEELIITGTNITKLDLTKSHKIKSLFIGVNILLEEISFLNNFYLKEIDIFGSPIKIIDLSSTLNLESICIRCLSIEEVYLSESKYHIQKELVEKCFLDKCKDKVKIKKK